MIKNGQIEIVRKIYNEYVDAANMACTCEADDLADAMGTALEAMESVQMLENKFVVGMKVHYNGDDADDFIECPVCKQKVAQNDDYPEMRPKHCPECGIKLIY